MPGAVASGDCLPLHEAGFSGDLNLLNVFRTGEGLDGI